MRLTRLRADSRGTPTARGRQCRMSKKGQDKNTQNTQNDLNKWKLKWTLSLSQTSQQKSALPKKWDWLIHQSALLSNPTWGDIFECCFKAQSSKLEPLFSVKRGKRDVRALSFELWIFQTPSGCTVQGLRFFKVQLETVEELYHARVRLCLRRCFSE